MRLRTIERPITQTWRPHPSEASITSCSRWMCEANDVTITRPGASRTIRRSAAATTCSLSVTPSRSAFVESASSSARPASPSRANFARSVRLAVDRRVVDLEIARVQERALIGVQRDRDRVGDRVRDAHELGAERPDLHRLAARVDLDQLRVVAHAVLVELRLDQPERQPRAPHLGHADLAHQVRQRADVILVTVRQDDRAQRARRIAQVAEVGQHEVDAQHLVAREAEPGVDQDALAVLLDHGHVLADLAETAERDDPDCRRHRVAVASAGP